MKLALVHDWLIRVGGAERVLFELHALWPQAPIYTLLADPAVVRRWLPQATVIPSSLQRIPFARRVYPLLAPAMPAAIESFDLSGYDTVLSSSVLFSKGIVVRPGTRHLCYCYSPSRLLWDRTHAYERRGVLSGAARLVMRTWDYSAAQRPDQFIAISRTVADRIEKYYRRQSVIVPPPIRDAVPDDSILPSVPPFYLAVGRLTPHKEWPSLITAFAKLGHRLVIVGDGPMARSLRRSAPANVVLTGWLDDTALDRLYRSCEAVIVPNEEDWGLTPIEAMRFGKPVLALRRGGAMETVLEGITGEFFDDEIPEAIADGMKRLRAAAPTYRAEAIRTHAQQFGKEQFATRMRTLIEGST